MTRGTIAGVPVDISRHRLYRRSRLRDLDAVGSRGRRVGRVDDRRAAPFDIHAAGMLALDVARVEAGLLLIEVDFNSSKKALIERAEVHAVRNGSRPPGAASTSSRSSAARPLARRAAPRPGPADRRPRDQLAGGRGAVRPCRPRAAAIRDRVAALPVPVYKDGHARWAARPRRRGRRC